MYFHSISTTKYNKFFSIRDGQAAGANGHSSISKRPRKTWASLSREAQALLTKLASNNTGLVGPRSCTELQNSVLLHTAPVADSETDRALQGGEYPDDGRNMRDARKRSHNRDLTQRAGLPVHGISSPQKRRRSETCHQPEEAKRVRSDGALQNGRYPCAQGPAKGRRLYGKSGFEGRILHGTDPQGGQGLPQVHPPRLNVPLQLPAVWPGVRSMGLYKDSEASCSATKTNGSKTNSVYRRHSSNGRDPTNDVGASACPNFPTGKPGVHYQPPEVRVGANTNNRVLRLHGGLHRVGTTTAYRESKKDQIRDSEAMQSKM